MNSSNKKQQFNRNKEKEMNWETNSVLLDRAKKQAKICLENGEDTRAIKFGAFDDLIFVSSDPDKVTATDGFNLDGTDFYLGTKKK